MSQLLEVFKRFNSDATRAILLAQEETRRSGHAVVGCAQLLLGLSLVERSPSFFVLKQLGLSGGKIRKEISAAIGLGDGHVPVEIPFTDEAKAVINRSAAEAAACGDEFIGTEHLLLAFINTSDAASEKILEKLAITKANLLDDVRKYLKPEKAT